MESNKRVRIYETAAPPISEAELKAAATNYNAFLETIIGNKLPASMRDTPYRVAKALAEMLRPGSFTSASFETDIEISGLQVIKGIKFSSLCEHHVLPFFGTMDIGYIPGPKSVIGLSKIPRLVGYMSAGFHLQEKLIDDIANEICEVADTESVIVKVSAIHTCMVCRGVKSDASTITSSVRGSFRDDSATRQEFYMMLHE